MINTNNATKRKSDKSSKIEQIGADQTLNVKNEEIDDAHNSQASPYHNNKTLKKQKKEEARFINKGFYYVP